jgi:hypothetical protein
MTAVKNTVKDIVCLMPQHTLFHCVLFVLAFSHCVSSPTARTVMNEFADHAIVFKISIAPTSEDKISCQASSAHLAFQPGRSASSNRAGFCRYAAEHHFVESPLVKQLSIARLLL